MPTRYSNPPDVEPAIALNLVIELPLIWLPGLGEAGMAVGTAASFAVQAIVMLWILDRRIGSLDLRQSVAPVLKMAVATVLMIAACLAVQHLPIFPHGERKTIWLIQLIAIMAVGAAVYIGACSAMGIAVLKHVMPKRKRA